MMPAQAMPLLQWKPAAILTMRSSGSLVRCMRHTIPYPSKMLQNCINSFDLYFAMAFWSVNKKIIGVNSTD